MKRTDASQAAFRKLLAWADGFVVSTPEYVHGLPGSFKNALDWIVSSGEFSKKPVLITHAGCRAVYMHPRNKEDRELKALAEKGGVIGIYMLPFLTEPDLRLVADDAELAAAVRGAAQKLTSW